MAPAFRQIAARVNRLARRPGGNPVAEDFAEAVRDVRAHLAILH